MNRECPRCHVVFWKDPGETLGAMYLDFAVAAGSFLICWAILALTTHLSDAVEMFILSAVACGSVQKSFLTRFQSRRAASFSCRCLSRSAAAAIVSSLFENVNRIFRCPNSGR
jgi:hypothetical protein